MSWQNKLIHVAVGVVLNKDNSSNKFLIAKRPSCKSHAGLWEFPGGKLEPFESSFDALQRELFEEVGILVKKADKLIKIMHNYKDNQVLLDTWVVKEYFGEPFAKEGQDIKWIDGNSFSQYEFPSGNKEIIKKLESQNSKLKFNKTY